MLHFIFKRIVISLTLLLFSVTAFAEDNPKINNAIQKESPTTTPQKIPIQITKDQWLSQVKKVVTEPICKGFINDKSISNRFKAMDITYDTCLNEIPPLTQACIKMHYDELPDTMTEQSASKWGRVLGECIGATFAKNHLYKEGETGQTKPVKHKQ